MKRHKRILAIGVGILLMAASARSLYGMTGTRPAIADLDNLPVIVLDPGHGGMDGGAVGVDGIIEKDINLSICLMLRDMLTVSGFEVIMTRDTDRSIHDEGIKTTRGQKTSDLRNRLAVANGQPNAILISVHQNKFGDSRSKGTQVFFGPLNENSEGFAEILREDFVANLQPDNKRQCKKAGKNLFLMYNAECPSVLVECGFLSNEGEAKQLTDPEYQSKIAFTILGSVVRFLELDSPGLDAEGVQAFV